MISINVLAYTIITLLWIALAAFVVLRIPRCKTLKKSLQIFIIIFLVLQILINGHQLYDLLVKENIIQIASKVKTNIISDNATLQSLSNLLVSSQWFNLLTLIMTVILYYIIFKSIHECGERNMDKRMVVAFMIITIIQYLYTATLKSRTENKLLIQAMAK